ncbi:MAG: ArsR family transcriptional regulator [Microbacteriaceae bacterium]|nr:ArsR family transcriptional regulator [Microbacteriaceae bacterium]
MSFINPDAGAPQPENRQRVTDVRALRALAHPLRLAILNHLMSFGAQTASQCADVVGSTASNCSYHLRSLARFGLVEALGSEDGRERPWRSAATGFEFRAGDDNNLAAKAVERVLNESHIDDGARLAKRALEARDLATPAEWRDAASAASYSLRMTPSELDALGEKLDALIRPYIALTRGDPPAGSAVVHLQLDAFLHPDGPR